MKVAFDTSVLVAGSIADHGHHQRALPWLDAARAGTIDGVASVHAFAETYATLTALPTLPRISTATALRVAERLARYLSPVALGWEDYAEALERVADRDIRSGGVYDALHVVGGVRSGASILLTFNASHFTRLVRAGDPRVLSPPDPAAVVLE